MTYSNGCFSGETTLGSFWNYSKLFRIYRNIKIVEKDLL